METPTELANFAFMEIGGVGQINDINDNSNPAILAKKFMNSAMKHILGKAAWIDCLKRETLTPAGTPVDEWAYRFVLPNDTVWVVEYRNANGDLLVEQTDYYLEAGGVHTNEAVMKIKYVAMVTDISKLEEHVAQSVAIWLAYLLVPDLGGGDETKTRRILERLKDTLGRATYVNARARRPKQQVEIWGNV